MQSKTELLRALELDREGDWDGAHGIVQKIESTESYWIHAYLHRKEGDLNNSNYWYTKAGKKMPDIGLDEEWETIDNYMQSA